MNKDLHILCAHLDDFEISCYGYVFKHHKQYENIYLHLATNNDHKEPITLENLEELNIELLDRPLIYKQHNFHSTRLRNEMDDLKNSVYTSIDFKRNFDAFSQFRTIEVNGSRIKEVSSVHNKFEIFPLTCFPSRCVLRLE